MALENESRQTEFPDEVPRFAMPQVVGVVMSREELSAVVQQSVADMAQGLGCSRLLALSYSARLRRLQGVALVGFAPDALAECRWTVDEFPDVARAVETRQIIHDARIETFPAPLRAQFAGEIVIVPLTLGARTLAVLVGQLLPGVASRSKTWQMRAEEVAARAALVVELERTAAAYQDEMRLRQTTREIAAAILEGRALEETAALIADIVGQRLAEERVALFLRDGEGKVQHVALRNVSSEYCSEAARMMPRSAIAARATATGLPVYVRNIQRDLEASPERRERYRRENITTILLATLHHQKTVIGALVVYPCGERDFSPSELTAFQSFADLATLSVSISQQIQQQRDMAMLDERNRLAREIHDTVAQSLVGLLLQLETTQNLLNADDPEGARTMLTNARGQAKKALEDTRRAVQGLSAASLERQSPAQAIAEEARQFEAESGVPAQFILTGEEQPLIPEVGGALLRIAQEALTNARKHAQARRVRVGLQYGGEDVTLLVEDDGVGFDTDAAPTPNRNGGYGLFGMTERARLLGGETRLVSRLGWGTQALARLPYRPASPLNTLPTTPPTADNVGAPGSLAMPGPVAPVPPQNAPPVETPSLAPSSAAPKLPPDAKTPDAPIRVLVVDDNAITRQGIRAMLETTGEVVVAGEASDGGQAVERAQELRPDVVLMDLQMPGVDGLEGMRGLRAVLPDLPVVIVTTFQTEASVRDALAMGAHGYLLKDAKPADLIAAVRAAYRGESLLAPSVVQTLSTLAASQTGERGEQLNARELEILQLLAMGARNKEIGADLFITPKTVEYHLTNIFNKLNVSNRTEAARAAIERGLLANASFPPRK